MANDTTGTKPAKKAAPRKAATKTAPAATAKTRAPRKAAQKAATAPPAPPPGWYLDTPDGSLSRYWDGKTWLGDPIPTGMVDPTDQPTTTLADATTYDVATETVTFRGRTMNVVQPAAEQLVVWQLTQKRLENLDPATATNQQAATLIGRALRVIQSVLADDADKDWVEDQILDKTLNLTGAMPIITTALTMFAEKLRNQNSGTARAAGKKPGTARRRR